MSLLNKVDDENFSEIVKSSLYYKDIFLKLGYSVSTTRYPNKFIIYYEVIFYHRNHHLLLDVLNKVQAVIYKVFYFFLPYV